MHKLVHTGGGNIHTEKKVCFTFFFDESLQKSHFMSPDHSEIFRACIWKVCLDAAKINEVQRISFLIQNAIAEYFQFF